MNDNYFKYVFSNPRNGRLKIPAFGYTTLSKITQILRNLQNPELRPNIIQNT